MLVRLKDKFPLVRIQAVYALRRLQDPSNAEDPVITDLLHLLNCDDNKYAASRLLILCNRNDTAPLNHFLRISDGMRL